MRALWLALALAAPLRASDEARLGDLKDLLGFVTAYEAGRPLDAEEKRRAWSALWESEQRLPPVVVARLRQLLLKVDEESGPLRGLSGGRRPASVAAPASDARERDELFQDVDALSYPPEVKLLFYRVVQYAPPEDARVAVEMARKEKPAIELDSRDLGTGSLGQVVRSRRSRPSIRLKPGVALVPATTVDERVPQLTAGGIRYYAIPASLSYYRRLSAPVPDLDVFKPGARSRPAGAYFGGEVFVYPDGSGYHRFSSEHLAGVLLHELFHLDTRRRGGGANVGSDELRSFLAQYRLYYRVQKRLGTADFLDLDRQGYANWLSNPVSLRWFLEAAYAPGDGAVESGGVFDAIDDAHALLRLEGKDFEAAKRRSLERDAEADDRRRGGELDYLAYLGLAKDPPAAPHPLDPSQEESDREYRRSLKERLARLEVDAELELEARLEDFAFREAESPSMWSGSYQFSKTFRNLRRASLGSGASPSWRVARGSLLAAKPPMRSSASLDDRPPLPARKAV